jgi:hypothetical protein
VEGEDCSTLLMSFVPKSKHWTRFQYFEMRQVRKALSLETFQKSLTLSLIDIANAVLENYEIECGTNKLAIDARGLQAYFASIISDDK